MDLVLKSRVEPNKTLARCCMCSRGCNMGGWDVFLFCFCLGHGYSATFEPVISRSSTATRNSRLFLIKLFNPKYL
jgi:hypothetical protein